jgi:hypothetical protein
MDFLESAIPSVVWVHQGSAIHESASKGGKTKSGQLGWKGPGNGR